MKLVGHGDHSGIGQPDFTDYRQLCSPPGTLGVRAPGLLDVLRRPSEWNYFGPVCSGVWLTGDDSAADRWQDCIEGDAAEYR